MPERVAWRGVLRYERECAAARMACKRIGTSRRTIMPDLDGTRKVLNFQACQNVHNEGCFNDGFMLLFGVSNDPVL